MVTTSGGFAYKKALVLAHNRIVTSTIGAAAAAAAATSWQTRIAAGTLIYAVSESCAVFVIVAADVSTVFVVCHHTVLMMTTSTFVR